MPNTPGFDTAAMAAAITAAQESGGPIIDAANPSTPDNGAPPGFDTTALLSGDPNGTVQIAGEGAGGVALSAPPPQPAQQPTAPEPAPYVAPDPADPALHQQGRQMGTPQPADDGPTMEPFDPYLGDPNQQQPAPQPAPTSPLSDPATDGATDTDTGHFDPSRVYELVLGHAPTADEVVQTVSLASRFASLSPEQQQWVDGIMGGRIDPRQIEAQLQAAQQQAQQPAPRPQRDPYDDPYTDPPAPDPALEAERQALAREREQLQQQQAQWEQQTIAHAQAEAQRALVEFRSAHADWAPEELAALEARVNQSAVWGGIYSSTGDAYSATAQTIQLEALNHPHFREKLMGAAATSPEPTADDVARATAAAALAGNGSGGGARPTGPSAPPSPTDPRLSQVAPPPGYAPVQQPVQPVHSALTTPQQTAGPDLNNRNEVALAMAAQIAQMVGDR
jgi:hypothetical protein